MLRPVSTAGFGLPFRLQLAAGRLQRAMFGFSAQWDTRRFSASRRNKKFMKSKMR
jgi:hypothetical protein